MPTFIRKMVGLLCLVWLSKVGGYVFKVMQDIILISLRIICHQENLVSKLQGRSNTEQSKQLAMSFHMSFRYDIAKDTSVWWTDQVN